MTIQLNAIYCGKNIKNTGLVKCFYDPANIEGLLLVPKGTVFSQADVTAWSTTLNALLNNNTPELRGHIIKRFEGVENKSTDASYSETPYGDRKKSKQGKYAWRWQYSNSGLAMHTKLTSFDGAQDMFDAFLIDAKNNTFMGYSTDGINYKGFSLDLIDIPNVEFNTGTENTKYYIEIGLEDSKQLNQFPAIVKLEDSVSALSDFNSLIDLEMSVSTAMTAGGLVKLKFKQGNGATNLYDLYSAALTTTSLYTAINASTGGGIPVTSVTASAGTKTLDVQLNAADPDYPATAGGLITITFGDVSAMVAAGIVGYSNAELTTARG
jgi:hypothetical protein